MGSLPLATDPKPVGSYPSSGIDVLIVGTGLAGLTAAIECTRKGHNVQVLERNASINTAGQFPSYHTAKIHAADTLSKVICTSWDSALPSS